MNTIQRIFSVAAMALSSMAMTVSAQDYTSLIVNPSFEDGTLDGWTVTNFTLTNNKNFSQVSGTWCVEKWVASGNKVGAANIKQTVRNLPNGVYTLTVAAQNYNQASTTTTCTGAYIYANKLYPNTKVNQPGDYTLSFTCTTGEALIGFNATSNANGNWLCVDNFRLTKTGEADKATCKASCDALVTKAETLLNSRMTKEPYDALVAAIALGKATTEESDDKTISDATLALYSAISDANESITACQSVSATISSAKTYQGKYMQQSISDALDADIEAASTIGNTTPEADFQNIMASLSADISAANASINAYSALNTEITTANTAYDETKQGAADFFTVLGEATTMYQAKEAATDSVKAMTEYLSNALFNFNIANATPGTGPAIEITSTNHYVPTGATQALMRFDYTGDNVKEKGICWSTDHNPTVLDNRTTGTLGSINGTIYRVKGLESSTVYYLRPYVINSTYEVVYGDEVKIVTHQLGNCTWSWDEGAPTEEANERCRTAMKQTIDYFNEWTGIKGFHLSGHYGASTPTADCSYGGWMRIGPSASYQAIGTVLHETGHGVGVGTQDRYWDTNVHNWKWYGSEANRMYSFLENKEADPYTSDFSMVGDNTHAWGSSASYDWFVNGADKDKHIELQYAGGCCLLYAMFIDGLNPTSSCVNGINGYTFNFDDNKKYFLMNKDASRGLGTQLYTITTSGTSYSLVPVNISDITNLDSAAWMLSYAPATGLYSFKNVSTEQYLSVSGTVLSTISTFAKFQLMPARTDVTVNGETGSFVTKGYWLNNNNTLSATLSASTTSATGKAQKASFNYADTSTKQQWIILSEDELQKYWPTIVPTAIRDISSDNVASTTVRTGCYNLAGQRVSPDTKGILIINGRKFLNK